MGYAGIIQAVESEHMRSDLPNFRAGDTVVVQVKVQEGNRKRLQAFEGVVLGKRNRGLNSSFIVRRIAHGVGVERTFQAHSPLIDSVTVKRRGDVRQAKLYYLRKLTGRKARIREKITLKNMDSELLVEPQEAVLEAPEVAAEVGASAEVEASEVPEAPEVEASEVLETPEVEASEAPDASPETPEDSVPNPQK